MKREIKIPDLGRIGPDTPLRLAVAAAIAFPDGGMTVSGLRHERYNGRLRIERIANKDFVTLKAIEEMRQRCAIDAKFSRPREARELPPQENCAKPNPARERVRKLILQRNFPR